MEECKKEKAKVDKHKEDVFNTIKEKKAEVDLYFTINNGAYKEGNYESLVVKLGEGKGENFWCVLFPPLCLMEAKESETYEYKLFVKEIFDKYL